MASRGREHRGRSRGASQAPPVFYQQAFTEAMSVAFTSFAQASAAGGQGGPSNLQRFKTHHPPTFTEGGGGGSDGGRPLVPTDREDIGGHGDHL